MKTLVLAFGITLAFCTTAMTADIACSTMTNQWWWSEATAEREMQEIADSVSVSVEVFTRIEEHFLSYWVAAHTGNGQSDLLILCGWTPHTIYPGHNAQPDGSLAELFLDDGNCIINTGDWMFYAGSGGHNGEPGLQNMMDIPGIEMLHPDGDMTPTTEGQLYTPSLEAFSSSCPWNLNELTNDWEVELILGQNADGTAADPAVVVNTVTGGRMGIFFQVANMLEDERSVVISEWINNWYLKVVSPGGLNSNSVPTDGAVDVPCDIDLTWKAGAFPATYDVYFGTIWEDVNSGTGDVVTSVGQLDTSFDPGRLEFDTTYFWRVDEVNSTPDSTVFKGDVWSFMVEPYAYPVEGVIATSNGISEEGAGIDKTVDGSGLNAADEHSTEASDMWLASAGAEPLTIQYEFDRLYKLNQMVVWNHNSQFEMVLGLGLKDVTVEYSQNGTDWTTLDDVQFAQATARSDYTANTTVDFGGVTARHVRLTVNSGWGVMGQYGLSEVRFSYVPTRAWKPEPADGETGVNVDAILNWNAGREAVLHEIYFSTDRQAVVDGTTLVDTVTESSYQPSALEPGQAYYWRINEVNETESVTLWEGEIWEFTTAE